MKKFVNIVSFESDVAAKDLTDAEAQNIKVITFDEVVSAGEQNADFAIYDAKPEDVYMLSYTSGTTGDPKGVKLQHKMVIQCAESTNSKIGTDKFDHEDIYVSYLPAAHSFEQAIQAMSVITGMRCGFYGGNPLQLVSEDLPALRPTFFPSVPRIFNRIYGKIQD